MRCLMVLVVSLALAAAEVPPGVAGLKAGNPVKVHLTDGRTLRGSVGEIGTERLTLRVDRGFFRTRVEPVEFAAIRTVERERGRWVGPVVVLGVVAGVVAGVAICAASGACTN